VVNVVPPAENAHASAPPRKLVASAPQADKPVTTSAATDGATIAAEPARVPVVSVVPPAERGHASAPPRKLGASAPQADKPVTTTALVDPMIAEPPRAPVLNALPPAEAPHANAPRRRFGARPGAPQRGGPRRLAALPSTSAAPRKGSEVPTISVLRGGPAPRYAGRPEAEAAPAGITVIRGTRPAGVIRAPGPLILRIPD
jgi:hypothetical protein